MAGYVADHVRRGEPPAELQLPGAAKLMDRAYAAGYASMRARLEFELSPIREHGPGYQRTLVAHAATRARDSIREMETASSVAPLNLLTPDLIVTANGERAAVHDWVREENRRLTRNRALPEGIRSLNGGHLWEATRPHEPRDMLRVLLSAHRQQVTYVIDANGTFRDPAAVAKSYLRVLDNGRELQRLLRGQAVDNRHRNIAFDEGLAAGNLVDNLGPRERKTLQALPRTAAIAEHGMTDSYVSGFRAALNSRYSEEVERWPGSDAAKAHHRSVYELTWALSERLSGQALERGDATYRAALNQRTQVREQAQDRGLGL